MIPASSPRGEAGRQARCVTRYTIMDYPNYNLEKKLINQGYQNIVGIDEVGRGAWAGPLVAVATQILNFKFLISKQIRDSKTLSESQREKIYAELSEKVVWSVGLVSHKEIDTIGITQANILVIKRAIENLNLKPDYLLIDKVSGFKSQIPHQIIIKGDRKILSIALASILAKVTRDRMMVKFHQKYPEYNFHKHKGYGTALHQTCLSKYGPGCLHRLSYKPVSRLGREN